MKIIDRIKQLDAEGKPWFSLEFFPPKSDAAVDPLLERVAAFTRLGPQFVDITWGAGGSTADRTLELTDCFQNIIGIEVRHLYFLSWSSTCVCRCESFVLTGLFVKHRLRCT
jgi:methylenetetrahydrofolate reductase (NADPH)